MAGIEEFKNRVGRSIKWTAISGLVTNGLVALQSAFLAGLLGPEAFGLVAILMVVVGLSRQLADAGLSNAIIHHQDTTGDELSSLYWVGLLIGLLIAGTVVVGSPIASVVTGVDELGAYVALVAIVPALAAFGQQFRALLRRDLRFERLAKYEVASAGLGSAVMLGAAVLGLGPLAFVLGSVLQEAVMTGLLCWTGFRESPPARRLRLGEVRRFLSFGMYQMGERVVAYVASNADYMMVGGTLGAEALGYYSLAYIIVTLPTRLNPIIFRVAFPAFAKTQENDELLRDGYCTLGRVMAMAVAPLSVGIATTAHVAIPLFWGGEWAPAVPLVQILAVIGLLSSMGSPSGAIMLAKGKAAFAFWWNVVHTSSVVAVVYAASGYDLLTLAWVLSAFKLVWFAIGHSVAVNRLIDLTWRQYLNATWRPLLQAMVMGMGVIGVAIALEGRTSGWLMFIALVMTGVMLYTGLLLVLDRAFVRSLWRRVSS